MSVRRSHRRHRKHNRSNESSGVSAVRSGGYFRLSRSALLASASIMVLTLASPARAVPIGQGSGSAASPLSAATYAAQQAQQQAQRAAEQAQRAMSRARNILQDMQSAQVAARAAAQQAASVVPNGLTAGGLVANPDLAFKWTGANGPTQTTSGDRTIVTIQQTEQKAIANWTSFNVGAKTTVNFDQQDASWSILNRVQDPSLAPSSILGTINAKGTVYVINQSGIIFGGTSQINVGSLVASSLWLNQSLYANGILNNSTGEFQFSALPTIKPPTDPLDTAPSVGAVGEVVVEKGAFLNAATSGAHQGGRIMLLGPNVRNEGVISTPDGQTILAAGLQVAIRAHDASDPSLRGLDVFVGKVSDPSLGVVDTAGSSLAARGVIWNGGLITAPLGNISLNGAAIYQDGVTLATTSVALNGRIDINAAYDAAIFYGLPGGASLKDIYPEGLYLAPRKTGLVEFGSRSLTSVLPEIDSTETVQLSSLQQKSQINVLGSAIHLKNGTDTGGTLVGATILAPSGKVSMSAGEFLDLGDADIADEYRTTRLPGISQFFTPSGKNGVLHQIYLDSGALIDVSGLVNVPESVANTVIQAELRAAQLADSPLQRDGALRGATVWVDLLQSGVFNGKSYIGTPFADIAGFIDLVPHTVAQLSVNGGSVNLNAGDAVVVRDGARISVAGGSIAYQGGYVHEQSQLLLQDGGYVALSQATPDRVYTGLAGGFTRSHSRWGRTETYSSSLRPTMQYRDGFMKGGDGGTLSIMAPAMVLDGALNGAVLTGPYQLTAASAPKPSTLNLLLGSIADFEAGNAKPFFTSSAANAQTFNGVSFGVGPDIILGAARASGGPVPTEFSQPLAAADNATLKIDASVFGVDGFGIANIDNQSGRVLVPAGVNLGYAISPLSGLSITARGIDVQGDITYHGGQVVLTGSLLPLDYLTTTPPSVTNPIRFEDLPSIVVSGRIDVSGAVIDAAQAAASPRITAGGAISISAGGIGIGSLGSHVPPTSFAYPMGIGGSVLIREGSVLDVSGGVLVSSSSKISYGNAGAISLLGLAPSTFNALIETAPWIATGGGTGSYRTTLLTSGELRGFSGAAGGSLALQGRAFQIGGAAAEDVTVISPDFFDRGGFSRFALTGYSALGPDGVTVVPGIHLVAGIKIEPKVQKVAASFSGSHEIGLSPYLPVDELRDPVSLTLRAINNSPARGDILIGEGAAISLKPGRTANTIKGSSIAISGSTVTVLGTLTAPGGKISIAAGSTAKINESGETLTHTLHLGANSSLNVAGATVLIPDARGLRTGAVLAGGSITLQGDIVAEKGSTLDVSGTRGVLDLPSSAGSGLSAKSVATWIESDGGLLSIISSGLLVVESTLRGTAGGVNAVGGVLSVSSSVNFGDSRIGPSSFVPSLIVTQDDQQLLNGITFAPGNATVRTALPGSIWCAVGCPDSVVSRGHFSIDRFASGGFDTLRLNSDGGAGAVLFRGDVTIDARRSLMVSQLGNAIYADGAVTLRAPYVALGSSYRPFAPSDAAFLLPNLDAGILGAIPAHQFGPGSLSVIAQKLIDIGNLALENISTTSFDVRDGDLRGFGVLDAAGSVVIAAGQVYAPTDARLQIIVNPSNADEGRLTISGGASRPTPLSVNGGIELYARTIDISGTVRAPFGTINVGFDPAEPAPKDPITGADIPGVNTLTLADGSLLSVSADGLVMPYGGLGKDGSWIPPFAPISPVPPINTSGAPEKVVSLLADKINSKSGARIDIAGGGDLYAYQWTQGNGGSTDILAKSDAYAVIPGYGFDYAPHYSNSASGYVNAGLGVGSQIYLAAGAGLAAGTYTLLPARYALLPGAYLVTPSSSSATGTVSITRPDGSAMVAGYFSNALDGKALGAIMPKYFEVAPGTVVHARAQYDDFRANTFLADAAAKAGITPQRLPMDGGRLLIAAATELLLHGRVQSAGASAAALGGFVDIGSSNPNGIAILGGTAERSLYTGWVTIEAADLGAFGASSLLVGGHRDGTGNITVTSANLILDNREEALFGQDVVLVSRGALTLKDGARIEARGAATGGAGQPLSIGRDAVAGSGNGSAVRVSTSADARLTRFGYDSSTTPTLLVGRNVQLIGRDGQGQPSAAGSVILNSTGNTVIDPSVVIKTRSLQEAGQQVTLALDGSYTLPSNPGIVLTGQALSQLLTEAERVILTSYRTLDIYGHGEFGTVGQGKLAFEAAQIRGFNTGAEGVTFAADTVSLGNRERGIAASADQAGASGAFRLNANTIELGAGALAIDQFTGVKLDAARGVLTSGAGGLSLGSDLVVDTPLVTAAKGVDYTISANGRAIFNSTLGQTATVEGGLAAKLTVLATTIEATGATFRLPSGRLSLHALDGDIALTDTVLDASGTEQVFFDVIRYSGGGGVALTSDAGSVRLTGGKVSVAAPQVGGDGGEFDVDVRNGEFIVSGTSLEGGGGAKGVGGRFKLDTKRLVGTAALDAMLDRGSFSTLRNVRVRSGDVMLDGLATAKSYSLSADAGAITATAHGQIRAGGPTGGTIYLAASDDITLQSGSLLDVSADAFDNAGKGGTIWLETRGEGANGIDIQTGSRLDLAVAGGPGGVLHLRAPRTDAADGAVTTSGAGTSIKIQPVNGTVSNASSIVAEGFKVYARANGAIDGVVQALADNDAKAYLGAAGSDANTTAIKTRLFGSQPALAAIAQITPGVEIQNGDRSAVAFKLNGAGSLISFDGGTTATVVAGTGALTVSTAGYWIDAATGKRTSFAAGATLTGLSANAKIITVGAGTLTAGGSVSLSVPGNINLTGLKNADITPVAGGVVLSLASTADATANTITLPAATPFTLPFGTSGVPIKSSAAGSYKLPSGVTTNFLANANLNSLVPGTIVTLNAPGTLTQQFTVSNGATAITLPADTTVSNVTLTLSQTSGANVAVLSSGSLALGSAASTTTSDWNLSTWRYGPDRVPGTLTLRATGNIEFYNTLTDGFTSTGVTYPSAVLPGAASASATSRLHWGAMLDLLMPAGSASWSYRVIAGADLSAADYRERLPLAELGTTTGSITLGKNGADYNGFASYAPKSATASVSNDRVPYYSSTNFFQVIRTGTGDIDLLAGQDIRLINPFAAIYTAGSRIVPDPAIFDAPTTTYQAFNTASYNLGYAFPKLVTYPAQYSDHGGNVTLVAGNDIRRLTGYGAVGSRTFVDASSLELPNNWLYRRGYIDPANGMFDMATPFTDGLGKPTDKASTTWWVDFSNFFQGVGTLGGGNVRLQAGQDIVNVDAVAPTNAWTPKNVLAATAPLTEYGGGDVSVIASRDISGGVYYVEKGKAILDAGGSIHSNPARNTVDALAWESGLKISAAGGVVSEFTRNLILDPDSWLPTTLFLGKGDIEISAAGDILVGPILNPFALPQGILNNLAQKTYFSTYAPTNKVMATSLSGDITLSNKKGRDTVGSLASYYEQMFAVHSLSPLASRRGWLRLGEVTSFAGQDVFSQVYLTKPSTLQLAALSGDVSIIGPLLLSPSPTGTLDLLASGNISGYNLITDTTGSSISKYGVEAQVTLSDADYLRIASPLSPRATSGAGRVIASPSSSADGLSISGATNQTLADKLAAHGKLTHRDDWEPVRLYARGGDITGLQVISPKQTRLIAGRDISDIALYLQNLHETDISIVSAGRDIVGYAPNSLARLASLPLVTVISPWTTVVQMDSPQAGDIQLGGPGSLHLLAGRNIDLGVDARAGTATAPQNGTATGIVTIGNQSNPFLPLSGASITMAAGLGTMAKDIGGPGLDYGAFERDFLDPATAGDRADRLLSKLGKALNLSDTSPATVYAAYKAADENKKRKWALEAFFIALDQSGRDHNDPDAIHRTYEDGFAAIAALFPANDEARGSILLTSRQIKTARGGDINMLVPHGGVEVGFTLVGSQPQDQGILTEGGGDIRIFADGSILLGTSRIFTLRGGNILIWSSFGDIAAGAASKTVKAAPPTRVRIDPDTGIVENDLAGLSTGGGIGTLAVFPDAPPSWINLIAPNGAVDAGDAGIRAFDINLAARLVLNAANIQVQGNSTGIPTVQAPPVAALTSASNVGASTQQLAPQQPSNNGQASVMIVEIVGYGGSQGSDQDNNDERKRNAP